MVSPASRGFGSRLLELALMLEFGGTVTLAFRPEGLKCSICLPIAVQGLGIRRRRGSEKGRNQLERLCRRKPNRPAWVQPSVQENVSCKY